MVALHPESLFGQGKSTFVDSFSKDKHLIGANISLQVGHNFTSRLQLLQML
jgi:hypothetical protein